MNKRVNILRGSTVLVIGGTGFIGSHLSKKLLDLGMKVTLLSLNKNKKMRSNLYSQFFIDITNTKKIKFFFKKYSFNYIFNLGGYVNHNLFSDGGEKIIDQHFLNIMGQFKYINKTKLIRYVYVGSADEYPKINKSERMNEKLLCSPRSPYSFAKFASTNFLQMLHISENWPISIARIFLTYGPGQSVNRLIPNIITQGVKYGSVNTTHGSQIRDFCFIEDVIEGLIKIIICDKAVGRIFNIASGKPVTVKNIIQIISYKIGFKVNYGALLQKKGESKYQVADITLSKKILKWQPKTSLEEGLTKTIKSFII